MSRFLPAATTTNCSPFTPYVTGAALKNSVRAVELYRGDDNYDAIVAQISGHAIDPTFALREVELALTSKDSAVLRIAAARAAHQIRNRDRRVTCCHADTGPQR